MRVVVSEAARNRVDVSSSRSISNRESWVRRSASFLSNLDIEGIQRVPKDGLGTQLGSLRHVALYNQFHRAQRRQQIWSENLNILRRLEARGTLSVWQISARVTTTSSRGNSTNSFSGEYSSCGIIRSCKNLVRNLGSKGTYDSAISILKMIRSQNISLNYLKEPHSPMGVTPESWCQSST